MMRCPPARPRARPSLSQGAILKLFGDLRGRASISLRADEVSDSEIDSGCDRWVSLQWGGRRGKKETPWCCYRVNDEPRAIIGHCINEILLAVMSKSAAGELPRHKNKNL